MTIKAKILIVDDVAINRQLLKSSLSTLQVEFVEADCGTLAIEKGALHDFALVLLDVNMPDMNGYQVAKALLAQPNKQHMPIIFLTAYYYNLEQKSQGYAVGAVDYLELPIDHDLLLKKVQVFVRLWQYSATLKETLHEMAVVRAKLEQEIKQRKATEAHLQSVVHLDPLTQLNNRLFFNERLSIELSRSKRHHLHMAVLFLDLNRFKWINDNLGHHQGDIVLCEVSQRLQKCLRTSDVLSRYGGDEFVILMTDVRACKDIVALLDRITRAIKHPIDLDDQKIEVNVSIGIACYPDDGKNEDELLTYADSAMYVAKKNKLPYKFQHECFNS